MTNDNRKSLLQRMDGLVGWTGIPRFARQDTRMRRLKWTPILILLFATVGLLLPFILPYSPLWMSSFESFVISLSASVAHIGPMRARTPMQESDEREESWRTRSNLFAYGAIALVAWIGILTAGIVVLWSDLVRHPVLLSHQIPGFVGYWLVTFACYLMVLFLTLPTLHASWTMPELIEDEPEPEGGLRFIKPRL